MLAPVLVPVGIAFAKRELEAAGSDRFDLAQHAADEFPAGGKPVAEEVRMHVMECIEQHLKELGRVSKVLHVGRHHLESVLGTVAKVVHDAGLAGSSGRREHHVAGAQGLPQFRDKRVAEA